MNYNNKICKFKLYKKLNVKRRVEVRQLINYLERKRMLSVNGRSSGLVTCGVMCRWKVAIKEECSKRLILRSGFLKHLILFESQNVGLAW